MRRFVLLLLAASGCHRSNDVAEVDAGSPTTATVDSPLRAFAASGDITAVTSSAVAFDGALRIGATSSNALETNAPATADAPLRVALGGGDVFAASLRPIGARAVSCARTSDARTVVCNEAYRGVDLAMIADGARAETFAVLRDASALEKGRARLTFALATSEGLFAQQEDARVVIRDRERNVRFTIPAPYAVDAKGARRDVTMRFADGRLELELDPAGLSYPVAIDPGLEAATWTDKTPVTTPPAIRYIDGFYDSIRKKTVFYGGYITGGVNTSYTWDGSTLTAGPALPRSLLMGSSVFASKRGVGWVFGGQSGAYSMDDIMEYDGTTWTLVTPSPRPSGRAGAGLAYDGKRDVVVLFGGLNTYGSYFTLMGDTWEHSSGGFSAKTPATKPTGRWATQMGYDPKRDVVVMYGGQTGTSGAVTSTLGDTWEWSGTDWKAITPTASPPALAGGALLWDEVGARLVLVGGNSVDNYSYDGVTWTKLTTSGFARRLQGAFVYDSTRKTMLAYGGMSSSGALYGMSGWTSPGTVYSSIVEWQPASCTSSSACGTGGTCVAGHCCATACSGSCQTCAPDGVCNTMGAGTTPSDPTCFIKCNGTSNNCTGSCATDTDCVAGARCASGTCVKYKPLGGVCTTGAECIGGTCVDGFCCDRPCGGTCEACDVAGKLGTCTTVPKDAAPHGTRSCPGTGVCAGVCDGTSNVCTFAGSTQACALATCIGNTLSQAGSCDGAGSCAKPGSVNCAPYVCTGSACTNTCSTSADCAATGYCSFSKCLAKKAELASCTSNEECLAGSCVAGACGGIVDAGADTFMPDTFVPPDTAVADTAVADTAVADTFVPPADTGSVEDVIATTPAPPFNTTKVPTEFTRCTKGSECTTGFCVDGVCCNNECEGRCHSCALLTSPGICAEEPEGVDLRHECGPANTCLGTCGKGGKCIGAGSGTMCAANRCTSASTGVGPAYCPGPGAKCPTDGATPFDCAPYACEPAFGACRSVCSSSNDCANGFVCDVDKKQCVAAPPPPAADDGGCAVGHGQRGGLAWTLVGLTALLATRRRKRARA